jgi:4-aminobutyrate aminotransferase
MAARHDAIVDVRGRGLMIGVEFADHDTAAAIEQRCFEAGLLVLTCGRSAIRIAPPLLIDADQADTVLSIFERVVSEVSDAGR